MKLKELEPIFQLSKPRGALVSDFLLLHYGFASLPVVLYQSIAKGHVQITMASLVSLLLTISVPLASEVPALG